jgi:MFS family permease
MVYPTLLAAVGDVAHPAWRATAVGVYRLWRDAGFAVGALLAGVVADLFGIDTAIWVVAAITAASGVMVAVRMYETHRRQAGGNAVSDRPDGAVAGASDHPAPEVSETLR